jgi:hypothetical protein
VRPALSSWGRLEFPEIREPHPAQQVLKSRIVVQEYKKPFRETAQVYRALLVRLLEQPEYFIALAEAEVNGSEELR